MTLHNIQFDRNTMQISGVTVPNMAFASAVASQIYEGFNPSQKSIAIMTDFANGKISIQELAEIAKKKLYV